jgi:hypothetical protein
MLIAIVMLARVQFAFRSVGGLTLSAFEPPIDPSPPLSALPRPSSSRVEESTAMPADQPRVHPTALPTARPGRVVPGANASVVPADLDAEDLEDPWWTPGMLRGLVLSLVLHALLLLCLAFWYFAPKVTQSARFDSRLAGSDRGVEDGLENLGGLNTALTIPEAPTPSPEIPDPMLTSIKPLEIEQLSPKLTSLVGADRASAEGGIKNNNPGAGAGDGFGLARFGEGGETVRGVEVKVGDPQFTLIWDTDADLDLHVLEPGGKEIYWEEPKGVHGGELDVDNTKGFGPENIYWLQDDPKGGEKVKGPGPPGEYKWFVVYWSGFGGIPKPTNWKVRIKHEGKVTVVSGKFRALNERSRVHTLTVKPESAVAGDVLPTP